MLASHQLIAQAEHLASYGKNLRDLIWQLCWTRRGALEDEGMMVIVRSSLSQRAWHFLSICKELPPGERDWKLGDDKVFYKGIHLESGSYDCKYSRTSSSQYCFKTSRCHDKPGCRTPCTSKNHLALDMCYVVCNREAQSAGLLGMKSAVNACTGSSGPRVVVNIWSMDSSPKCSAFPQHSTADACCSADSK